MNRKQMANRIINGLADEFIHDIDCGDEVLSGMNKDELVELVYSRLIYGTRAKHFKFLTADWIRQTIVKALDKACYNWGVEL